MFGLFKKKKEITNEKPKDYISDISGYGMKVLKPVLGGHLYHGFTAYRSWSGELPTSLAHWIKISTSDSQEREKYVKKLSEIGYTPYFRNKDVFEKKVSLSETWEEINSLDGD